MNYPEQVGDIELSTTRWFEKSNLVQEGVNVHEQGPLLCSYTKKNAENLASESVVAVALDDARIGRKPVKIVAVGFPRLDAAAWLCPQVFRGRNG